MVAFADACVPAPVQFDRDGGDEAAARDALADGVTDANPDVPAMDAIEDVAMDATEDAADDDAADASDGAPADVSCAADEHACGALCMRNDDPFNCGSQCGVACPAPSGTLATCDGQRCGIDCPPGFSPQGDGCVAQASNVAPPMLLWPPSGARVNSRRPDIRWRNAGAAGAYVEICRDRDCSSPWVATQVSGESFTPEADIPPGVWFWRARGWDPGLAGAVPGPTWEFRVPLRTSLAAGGTSWGSLPDFDGDGRGDVAAGAPGRGPGAVDWFASAAGGPSSSPTGERSGAIDSFGASIALTDVDGDGFADMLVGVTGSLATDVGSLQIFTATQGAGDGFSQTPRATVLGMTPGDHFGIVAAAGDVDGDGFNDVFVAASGAMSDAGTATLYFGGADANSFGTRSATVAVGMPNSHLDAVAGACDFDGDGNVDVAVGGPGDQGSLGEVRVLYGQRGGPPGARSVTLAGQSSGTGFGTSVACVGDVNGDGTADLAVGAPTDGAVAVFFGSHLVNGTTPDLTLRDPNGEVGVFGVDVSGVGDLNGDGYDDIAVGSASTGNTGVVWWYGGSPTGPAHGGTMVMDAQLSIGAGLGSAIGSATDVDGDGYDDLVVGVPGENGGEVMVFRGSATGPAAVATWVLTAPAMRGGLGASIACPATLRGGLPPPP